MIAESWETVVTSAVVATVVGAAINEWQHSRRVKHSARFEALSAAVALEGYAIECAERISDHDLAVDSAGHAGAFLGTVPDLPRLSVAASLLRPRKAALADRLMTFPQDARQADQFVAFWWDVTADAEETREAAVTKAAQMGVQAVRLATALRTEFTLPPRKLVFGQFDVLNALEKRVNESPERFTSIS
ncbi:MAG: hypothetical protein ACQEUG_03410 [Pseudomonadota bacterium]